MSTTPPRLARARCDASPKGRRWRSFPTPERRSFPIPAISWSPEAVELGLRRHRRAGPVRRARRALRRRSADRPFLLRGVPAAQARRRGGSASTRSPPCPARSSSTKPPGRLAETLADLALELGPRPAAVARELTKLHEEVRRGALDELAAEYAADEAPQGRDRHRRRRGGSARRRSPRTRSTGKSPSSSRTSRSRTRRRRSPPSMGCRDGRSMRARWRSRAPQR